MSLKTETFSKKRMCASSLAALMLSVLLTGTAAQTQNAPLYVYPLKKQNKEQQDKDRY